MILYTSAEQTKLAGMAIKEAIPNTETLTDGATIAHDINSFKTVYACLVTAESAVAITLSNVIANSIIDYTVQKTIAGDSTITFDGTGLRFVDYDNKALPATSLAIVLSDTVNFHFTISCKVSGLTYSSDKVIMVQMK